MNNQDRKTESETADGDGEDVLVLTVDEVDHGLRLDRYLADHCDELSRTRLKKLIQAGAVTVSGDAVQSPSCRVETEQVIVVFLPPPVDDTPVPQDIPLDIVYEDEHLVLINKPAGMVVHPAPGHRDGTLVNALLYHCGDSLSGIGGVRRPGIVHRLDKDTTGLIMVAKHDKAHRGLSAQLADRSLSRHYTAFVWGVPDFIRDKIDAPVGRHPVHRQKMAVVRKRGRRAVTHYERQEIFGHVAAEINCQLETGRTHQIRVHMAHAGYPLIGEPVYKIQPTRAQALMRDAYDAKTRDAVLMFPRQALHARELKFIHPVSEDAMSFTCPLPPDMEELKVLLETSSR